MWIENRKTSPPHLQQYHMNHGTSLSHSRSRSHSFSLSLQSCQFHAHRLHFCLFFKLESKSISDSIIILETSSLNSFLDLSSSPASRLILHRRTRALSSDVSLPLEILTVWCHIYGTKQSGFDAQNAKARSGSDRAFPNHSD